MRKFLPFSKRQPSLDRYTVNRGTRAGSDRFSGKALRRSSNSVLNARSIQVVRGAYNIDLNKVDASFTKLHRACLLNDETQVHKHLHKVDNNARDNSNRYPIHLAAVNGNFTIIKLLIENRANPNVQDNEGNTPVIKAIECGHEHLVKYLLSNGADPNLRDNDNNSAFHWAVMTESLIAMEALLSSKKCDFQLRNNKDETCMHLAVRSPLISTLTYETIMRSGCNLDARDQLGMTSLEIAQACSNENAIKAFVQCSDISSSNNNEDETPTANIMARNPTVDDYKSKYLSKNRENLEFEKKLIKLNASFERLKLDMSLLKEKNQLLASENAKLKAENEALHDKLINSDGPPSAQPEREAPKEDTGGAGRTATTAAAAELATKSIQDFVAAKAMNEKRINKLKFGNLQSRSDAEPSP